ncbi:MAG: hypothetical protein IPF57_12575 [Gammaproteobacteria bacterium]|jgi:hypothetical protein|nr:hypothetical protein [Gammaproteobacteria bacterium]MBK9468125.1 hypothetical protein [Gammaproteobacteria bacterium]MBP6480937.1 hypothetical protein [Pseudomonadales bacterium]MBP7909746.1 hypothetical protein [Pseudomonadales bacterium]
MIWWILLAVVVAGAVFALRGRAAAPSRKLAPRTGSRGASAAANPPGRGKAPSEAIDDYRGTMLFPQKDCCEAVLRLRGRTFAEHHAPTLPVPGCDREACGCKLHQVIGRRRGPRRLVPDRRDDVRFKEDRRQGKDRRSGVDVWK